MQVLKIDLAALSVALAAQGPGIYYLDLESGDVLLRMPDQPAPGESDKYNIEPQRYLRINALDAGHQLALREAFLASVADPFAHAALELALTGRKPLRSFSYALEQFPMAGADWAAYQARLLQEYALDWLQENGLDAAED